MTNKKNVVVALPGIAKRDVPFAEKCALEMEELGNVATLVEADTSDIEGFLQLAKNADGVLTSWGMRFTPEVIHALKQCAIIGVGSVGVDMVDVDAATDAGIVVTNVPDIFIEEVADHTMMLLLACYRRVKLMDKMVSEGRWYKGRPVFNDIPRIWGQTLGLISFGNVARCLLYTSPSPRD